MHRFVAMVQAFGMIALAIGVDAAVRRAQASVGARRVGLVAGALAVAALAVPVVERVRFVQQNDTIASARRTAVAADRDLAAAIAHLSALPPGRVYAGLHNDWGASAQVADIPLYTLVQSSQLDVVGYPFAAMAFPAEWLVRADFSRRDHLDLFGARWIVAPEGAPVAMTAVPRRRFGSLVVLEIPDSGYFDVGRVERIAAARPFRSWTDVYEAGRTWMFGSGPSEGRYAAFLTAPPPLITGEVRGRVEDERVAPGRFGATVTMETHGDVILKATKHPWWRCAVDGVPARITPVFPGFQSVRLTPGQHRVEFAYAPPAWKKGLFAAAVVLALAGLAWLVIDRVRS